MRAFVDARLKILEERVGYGEMLPLRGTGDQGIDDLQGFVSVCLPNEGKKSIPDPGAGLLDEFNVPADSEPSRCANRDNCRELVYYGNCINMELQEN